MQKKTGLTQNDRQQTRYFTPLYEVVDEDDSQKLIHIFSSPTGIFAIFTIENGNNGRMKYVLKDHQGSLAALVNEKSGTEYFSFDAWGRRRNAQTWAYTNMPISFGTTRGFTMHEHLDEFKLINMNGRVYDPLVGRFISPDPFVQMPDYSQSYNRYSYAFNNPLRFSDPSGFFAEGDSTIRPTAELPFFPPKTKPSYRPKASTNTDNTSLGPGVTGSETTLPIPYLSSKLSMDAEEQTIVVCPNCIDPSTIQRNIPLVGGRSTYAGGNNPMTYNKDYTYLYIPTMLTDYPAIGHDRRYDKLQIAGIRGLFLEARAIGADWRFVSEQLMLMSLPLDYSTRINAGILGLGLGAAALPKTVFQLSKPNGYPEMMMWYHISNYGVTNNPGN